MSLLSIAFFTSSYWQPVSLSTPLSALDSTDSSSNLTTFRDALLTSLAERPELLASFVASLNASNGSEPRVPLLQRGWLNLPRDRSIFSPFNVTHWELQSVEAFAAQLKREAAQERSGSSETDDVPDPAEGGDAGNAGAADDSVPPERTDALYRWTQHFMLPAFQHWTADMTRRAPAPSPGASPDADGQPSPESPPAPDTEEVARKTLPWLRREYDLKPYGIDVILDFGWARTPHHGGR
jgi:hypothetical protein